MFRFGELSSGKISEFTAATELTGSSAGIESYSFKSDASIVPPLTLTARDDTGASISPGQLANQFLIYQWGDQQESFRLLPSNEINPSLEGKDPDVFAKVDLLSFHIGQADKKNEDEEKLKAVMRVDFGQDEQSNTQLDQITYSILAGLDLYDQSRGKPSKPGDLKADFNQAFAKRPIQIAGGVGKLRFEVCKLPEPTWWQEIFRWLKSDAAKSLTAALGFPALASQAVSVVDKFINDLLGNKPEVLFQSRAMTLALSQTARADFTGNIPSVQIGCLKPGVCLLARGKDLPLLNATEPVYRGEYGLLVPKNVSQDALHTGAYENPYEDMTYGVFRVRLSETRLAPF